jgi:hypothetical protein
MFCTGGGEPAGWVRLLVFEAGPASSDTAAEGGSVLGRAPTSGSGAAVRFVDGEELEAGAPDEPGGTAAAFASEARGGADESVLGDVSIGLTTATSDPAGLVGTAISPASELAAGLAGDDLDPGSDFSLGPSSPSGTSATLSGIARSAVDR